MIDNYTYAGLKGLVIVGIFALAMSTTDSSMNSASVMISHDVCKPLGIFVGKELLIAKIIAMIVGSIAILLALSDKSLLSIVLKSAAFYIPVSSAMILDSRRFK